MVHLLGVLPDELQRALHARGVPCEPGEARRVVARVVADGADDPFPDRRPVQRGLRAGLEGHVAWDRPQVEERVTDPEDGSVRYLFRAQDGARFEAVRIGLHKEGRSTVCLSSQAGCAMRCDFCATGRLGLGRNLTAAEMVGQWLTVRDEAPGRVTGAVFMGQGEPFHNYDPTMLAARILSHPCGGRIAAEAISVSTVGLVGGLRRFTEEGHAFRLVVSLHSMVPRVRARLLPVVGRQPLEPLIEAMQAYAQVRRTRVTVAWTLMGGVNHGPEEVAGLRRLAGELPIRINLIDVNETRPGGYRRATEAERGAFLDALHQIGVPVVRRYSVGRSRHSACGMLASKRLADLQGAGSVP